MTGFLWRKTPSELQDLSPEEYHLMLSWAYVLIDGVNSLVGAFTKNPQTKEAAQEIKNAANKVGIKIPDFVAPLRQETSSSSVTKHNSPTTRDDQSISGNFTPSSSAENQNNSTKENINLDGVTGKNLAQLKDPRVTKAMRSSHADMKFEQYAKMGLLDLCLKQRKERLGEE